ncbi:MAG: ATP-binding protein [Myxococcota bacterium]|jgi:tRNA 2-thiocytidine biosynthesis protein TtcA|nr:ATP-binding protein [Myxococcota bacterium]
MSKLSAGSTKVPQRLQQRIGRLVGACVEEHALIASGDRILIAVSGGKDSYALLHELKRMQAVAPIPFELLALHVNMAHPRAPMAELVSSFAASGVPLLIENLNLQALLQEKLDAGASPCSLCSRVRRGILYTQAKRLGCHKIALGHHRDDAIETLLLNMFYSGQLKGMPAKLRSDDGENVVIRPLLYVPEAMIVELMGYLAYHVDKGSPCGQTPYTKRSELKALLQQLEQNNPKLRGNIFASMRRVVRSHLLD